eukprot:TRINITY_DN139_c8_g1_i1.p1 TRINITY_DN139_c8_g1~~TRINITY_DN139_c8_g1_i1.p1  ORF type:complete len:1967 (+),score=557.35 TRINITY_DN139_c8_g1_i1:49-5949(+)
MAFFGQIFGGGQNSTDNEKIRLVSIFSQNAKVLLTEEAENERNDNDLNTLRFVNSLEACLNHRGRDSCSFWLLTAAVAKQDKVLSSAFQMINKCMNLQANRGLLRAWLRQAMNENALHIALARAFQNRNLISRYFEEGSLMADETFLKQMVNAAKKLADVSFSFVVDSRLFNSTEFYKHMYAEIAKGIENVTEMTVQEAGLDVCNGIYKLIQRKELVGVFENTAGFQMHRYIVSAEAGTKKWLIRHKEMGQICYSSDQETYNPPKSGWKVETQGIAPSPTVTVTSQKSIPSKDPNSKPTSQVPFTSPNTMNSLRGGKNAVSPGFIESPTKAVIKAGAPFRKAPMTPHATGMLKRRKERLLKGELEENLDLKLNLNLEEDDKINKKITEEIKMNLGDNDDDCQLESLPLKSEKLEIKNDMIKTLKIQRINSPFRRMVSILPPTLIPTSNNKDNSLQESNSSEEQPKASKGRLSSFLGLSHPFKGIKTSYSANSSPMNSTIMPSPLSPKQQSSSRTYLHPVLSHGRLAKAKSIDLIESRKQLDSFHQILKQVNENEPEDVTEILENEEKMNKQQHQQQQRQQQRSTNQPYNQQIANRFNQQTRTAALSTKTSNPSKTSSSSASSKLPFPLKRRGTVSYLSSPVVKNPLSTLLSSTFKSFMTDSESSSSESEVEEFYENENEFGSISSEEIAVLKKNKDHLSKDKKRRKVRKQRISNIKNRMKNEIEEKRILIDEVLISPKDSNNNSDFEFSDKDWKLSESSCSEEEETEENKNELGELEVSNSEDGDDDDNDDDDEIFEDWDIENQEDIMKTPIKDNNLLIEVNGEDVTTMESPLLLSPILPTPEILTSETEGIILNSDMDVPLNLESESENENGENEDLEDINSENDISGWSDNNQVETDVADSPSSSSSLIADIKQQVQVQDVESTNPTLEVDDSVLNESNLITQNDNGHDDDANKQQQQQQQEEEERQCDDADDDNIISNTSTTTKPLLESHSITDEDNIDNKTSNTNTQMEKEYSTTNKANSSNNNNNKTNIANHHNIEICDENESSDDKEFDNSIEGQYIRSNNVIKNNGNDNNNDDMSASSDESVNKNIEEEKDYGEKEEEKSHTHTECITLSHENDTNSPSPSPSPKQQSITTTNDNTIKNKDTKEENKEESNPIILENETPQKETTLPSPLEVPNTPISENDGNLEVFQSPMFDVLLGSARAEEVKEKTRIRRNSIRSPPTVRDVRSPSDVRFEDICSEVDALFDTNGDLKNENEIGDIYEEESDDEVVVLPADVLNKHSESVNATINLASTILRRHSPVKHRQRPLTQKHYTSLVLRRSESDHSDFVEEKKHLKSAISKIDDMERKKLIPLPNRDMSTRSGFENISELISVKVVSTRISTEGGGKHVQYGVHIIAKLASSEGIQEKVIARRYSRFKALHEALCCNFPNNTLQLPKSSWRRSFDPQHIESKRQALNDYLQLVMKDEELVKCGALKDFVAGGIFYSKRHPKATILQENDVKPFEVRVVTKDNTNQVISRKGRAAAQHNMCAKCRTIVSSVGQLHTCYYSGDMFCGNCYSHKKVVIPARVLHHWDFKKYRVCDDVAAYLESSQNSPNFNIEKINPTLFDKNANLRHIRVLRDQLFSLNEIVHDCADSQSLILLLADRRFHLFNEPQMFALRDLIDVGNGALVEFLMRAIDALAGHVFGCSSCMNLGSYCAVCGPQKHKDCSPIPRSIELSMPPEKRKETLFKFQIKDVDQCPDCHRVCHKKCYPYHKCQGKSFLSELQNITNVAGEIKPQQRVKLSKLHHRNRSVQKKHARHSSDSSLPGRMNNSMMSSSVDSLVSMNSLASHQQQPVLSKSISSPSKQSRNERSSAPIISSPLKRRYKLISSSDDSDNDEIDLNIQSSMFSSSSDDETIPNTTTVTTNNNNNNINHLHHSASSPVFLEEDVNMNLSMHRSFVDSEAVFEDSDSSMTSSDSE